LLIKSPPNWGVLRAPVFGTYLAPNVVGASLSPSHAR
jgi:hypothetical protein